MSKTEAEPYHPIVQAIADKRATKATLKTAHDQVSQLDRAAQQAMHARDGAVKDLTVLREQHFALTTVNTELHTRVAELCQTVGRLEGYIERVEHCDKFERGWDPAKLETAT